MNVIVIDIDSLRADHVGAYGYDAQTTPNIDALAADGIRFDRAYAANSPCMPSRAALVSGRYGVHNGVETHGPPGQTLFSPATRTDWDDRPAAAFRSLPEQLFNNRFQTGAISSFPRHPALWFYHVWHEFYQPQEPVDPDRTDVPTEEPRPDGLPTEGFQTPRGANIADLAIQYLDRHTDEDLFLYTQFWDPHEPYNRTHDEIEPFRTDTSAPPYPTADQIEEHRTWDVVRGATDMNVAERSDLLELLARYDAEIRYVDEHVGRLIDELKRQEMYDESLIFLTADHGEEFGEHGQYRHHCSTHDGTQRIPLIVKPPAFTGTNRGGATDALVTNVDIAPTVVDYVGLETPAGWQGRSLRPVLEQEMVDWRDDVVFDHGLYRAQRAIRTDRWKLIRTHHAGLLDGVTPEYQLFDMTVDPWEQDDVAADHPEMISELKDRLLAWTDEHVGPEEDPIHRIARVGPTGYNWFKDTWDGV